MASAELSFAQSLNRRKNLPSFRNARERFFSPFECWLILRGVKTLAVRMEQHDRSGRKVADYLSKHKKVQKVFYPGLPDHPQHELAKRQMSGFGSMIAFETGSLAERQQDAAQGARLLPGRVAGRSRDSDLASRHR